MSERDPNSAAARLVRPGDLNTGSSASDLVSSLHDSLGASYSIERELGGGGMSRVYVATDASLDRRVVVKVLMPELAQGLSVERFTREIRLAAALQDPHIVPVLSAGTTGVGLPYYTMPFVEGRSLRARLGDGPMSMDEALRVLRDVAEALEYAHAHGVVHRDIKPENVLLSGRAAVVADFGIAKALSAARTAAPGGTLTQVGQSLGTPAYMAPEQATGDETDHRADLYSWGLVAYELLAGAHPFANKSTVQQLIAAQVTEQPKNINELKPSLPPPLGALVMRCLAKIPGDRPQTATEVLAELSAINSGANTTSGGQWSVSQRSSRMRIAAIAAVVIIAIAAAAFYLRRSTTHADGPPSLAVLPFEHQGDAADAYLTDGITDEIRGKLTGVQNLIVIARASSNAYRGSKKTPREIAEELGVRYLLSGTVSVVGTGNSRQVMVRPELVEITQDAKAQSRWQQTVDASAIDVLKVQGTIAEKVVGAMEVALGSTDRQRLVQLPTADPVAYDLYLRGLSEWKYGAAADPTSLRGALNYFTQAVARDPKLAEGWSAVARGSSLLYANGTPTPELAQQADEAVNRLEALQPDGAEVHRARAAMLRLVRGDFVAAISELEKARRSAPNDWSVRSGLALAESDVGRFDDALRDVDAAIRLDPRSANPNANRSRILVRMRRFDEARSSAARAVALAPTSLTIAAVPPTVELAAGNLPAAQHALRGAMGNIARDRFLAFMGNYGDQGWMLEEADQQRLLELGVDAFGGDRFAMTTTKALQYWWRGDSTKARLWADSALREIRKELRAEPNDPQRRMYFAQLLAIHGERNAALSALSDAKKLINEGPNRMAENNGGFLAYVAARTAIAVGDREQALAWIRETLARKIYVTAPRLRLDPSFKALRGDPRFEEILNSGP